jgi:hypothetical protein
MLDHTAIAVASSRNESSAYAARRAVWVWTMHGFSSLCRLAAQIGV